MGRRASREAAMKLIYQTDIQKEDREQQIKTALDENGFNATDSGFVEGLVDGVAKNTEYIDAIIEKNSKGWKLNRIPKVDLAILRLGIYEICFRDDIPYSVSVNEAVELAKKYSSEDAGAFINGVLSKVPKMKAVPADSGADL